MLQAKVMEVGVMEDPWTQNVEGGLEVLGGLTGNLESALCWAVAMVTSISAAGLLRIQSEHLERPQKKIPILESLGGFCGPDAAAIIGFLRGLCPASRTLRGFKWCFSGTHISQQCLGGH